MTSKEIKLHLMSYYRFQRQCLVVDEATTLYGSGDIMVDTGDEIHEVEIKVSKSDLTCNETRKPKHALYKACQDQLLERIPNKFSLCVPTDLVEAATAWVEKINPLYGVIECLPYGPIVIRRSAKSLHKIYSEKRRWDICLRMASKLITLMKQKHAVAQ